MWNLSLPRDLAEVVPVGYWIARKPGLGRVRDLDRAIALDPGYAESHYERGRFRIELGQYPQGD